MHILAPKVKSLKARQLILLWLVLVVFIIVLSLVTFHNWFWELLNTYDKLTHLTIYLSMFMVTRLLFNHKSVLLSIVLVFAIGLLAATLQLMQTTACAISICTIYNITCGIGIGIILSKTLNPIGALMQANK